MSSEREKLIEIWLDSAGERQYQFAFRNALLNAGHTILHDTSHTALELGKDVISIDPKGTLNAYQLKGNPGARLTISQWHGLIPQINALVYQPVAHPAVSSGTLHSPFPVTNGEIHEDVLAAIAAYNDNARLARPKVKPLKTLARGQLLKMIVDSANTIWPVDIETQRNVLNVFVAKGGDELPTKEFVDILSAVLGAKYSDSAIPAAHPVTTILASNWIGCGNFFEVVKMHALLMVASTCYQERFQKRRSKDNVFIEEIIFSIRAHLRCFLDDITSRPAGAPFLNKSIFDQFAYYHPRKKMISGLVSAALLDSDLVLEHEQKERLRDLLRDMKHSQFLLWEGIVPYCLAEFWALSKFQGTIDPDVRLMTLARDILNLNNSERKDLHLPGPYYTLREVIEWKYRLLLEGPRSELDEESYYRRSWYAEALFLLLVRRNYKVSCKSIWQFGQL